MHKRPASFLANLHYVTPDVARCAQPFFRGQWDGILHGHGFASVLNLRGENQNAAWYHDEIEACAAHGCQHKNITLSSKRLPSRQTLIDILDALQTLPKPLLIKCSGGADRTGLVSALFLLDQKGPEAMAEAQKHLRAFPYLHRPKPYQRWIAAFLDYYANTNNTLPLSRWIGSFYSPEVFATYLNDKGQGDHWMKD
ncbi:MAG: hypothetical protein EOM37_03965 [Proteobacteria bacterium]|jgi:hypothetical protein|nr:tyrosine-protein phosphatase [Alphaproteobacteria bacterium]NCC03191.1 hypothetical protein [Pseudomonadota bacterium]